MSSLPKKHQKYLKKTSETQKDLMIQYFETHEGAIDVVSANNTDTEVKRKIWSEISQIMNQVEGGVEKNDLKWSKTWADMKLYTKNRARAARSGHNIPAHTRKPSDLDRRILKVTGHEDLLRDWEAAITETDTEITVDYEEKVKIDDADHEVVVTEGTDYEYIDEDELAHVEQHGTVRLERYFKNEPEPTIEYSAETEEPVRMEILTNKRKNQVKIIEFHEENQEETQQATKRLKTHTDEEEETQDESEQDDHTYEQDPMVGAINNLAHALNNVASALTSFAEVAKSYSKR